LGLLNRRLTQRFAREPRLIETKAGISFAPRVIGSDLPSTLLPYSSSAMSRWKAAGMHFGLSVAIATALLLLMLALWYPPPYFALMGGATLVLLIAGCDVVLGPLITLIIFKSGKKGLRFDLTMIGLVQSLALGYGVYTMFEARPAFTVFAVDRFEIVAANDIRPEELARARPEFSALPLTGPRVVGAVPPADSREQMEIAAGALAGGEDIKNLPRLYVSYESVAKNAAERAMPLAALQKKIAHSAKPVVEEVTKLSVDQSRLGYLPLVGRFKNMSAIVDKQSGKIQTIVDAPPW